MNIFSIGSALERYFNPLIKDNDVILIYIYDIFWYLVNTHCNQLFSHYTSHAIV